MRNPGLMTFPLLLEACEPTPRFLESTDQVATHMVGEGVVFTKLCEGYKNGFEALADERSRYLLNNRLIRVLEDDLSAWECTPVLSGGGVVTRLQTSFRDSNGTVWVVDMTPTTDAKEDLSASIK